MYKLAYQFMWRLVMPLFLQLTNSKLLHDLNLMSINHPTKIFFDQKKFDQCK